MNLFGLSIGLARNGTNNKYVKKEDCHLAQESIRRSITLLRDHFDLKFDAFNMKLDSFNLKSDILNTRITDLMSKR